MAIRRANIEDLEQITEIYNQAVRAGFQAGNTIEVKVEERVQWFEQHLSEKYPIFVYESDKRIAGWISISPYTGRQALRFTAELSYYIDENHQGRGIGSMLLQYAIDKADKLNLKTYLAILIDRNIASMKLLKKFGFERWGHLPGVADFNGAECGHYYYGKRI